MSDQMYGMHPPILGTGQNLSSLDKQLSERVLFADGSSFRHLLGKRRPSQLFSTILSSRTDLPSTFPVRHAWSFVRPIRPSWSCGQPIFDHHFNAGQSFADLANFGTDITNFCPELVKFSLDFSLETSEIFAHVAAEFTDLAANI